MRARHVVAAAAALFLAAGGPLAAPASAGVVATSSTGSSSDRFQNASVVFASALYPGSSAGDLFGGAASTVEPGNTIFADNAGNPRVIWDLGSAATINRITATLADDSNTRSNNRGVSQIVFYAGNDLNGLPSIGSVAILPNYTANYGSSQIAATLDLAAPGSYRYFGFAADNATGLGARVLEIDGFAAAVPESATWALMILGIGAVGAAMRAAMRRSNRKFDARIKRIAAGLEP